MRRGEYAPQGERVARSQKAIGSSLGMRVPPQSDLLSPGSEYHRTRWVTRQDVADRGAGRWRAQNLIKYIANVSTQDIGRDYITRHSLTSPKRSLWLSALRTPSPKRAADQDDVAQSLGGHLWKVSDLVPGTVLTDLAIESVARYSRYQKCGQDYVLRLGDRLTN